MSNQPALSFGHCTWYYARHFLRFKFPFGTAHGVRSGTETILLRVECDGFNGFSEVALPPYLDERPEDVIDDIQTVDKQLVEELYMKQNVSNMDTLQPFRTKAGRALAIGAFNALSISYMGDNTSSYTNSLPRRTEPGCTLATVGLGHAGAVREKINALPNSGAVKVKLEARNWRTDLSAVLEATRKPVFLDGNQGLGQVGTVLDIVRFVGTERLIGIEQPFGRNDLMRHHELAQATSVPVYADESIQGPDELIARGWAFGGVNLKLVKCGGLDRAVDMIRSARSNGLRVMLGCMSEGTLGCASMASLQRFADLIDLDGPWLVENDLFEGLVMEPEGIRSLDPEGSGVHQRVPINWTRIGA